MQKRMPCNLCGNYIVANGTDNGSIIAWDIACPVCGNTRAWSDPKPVVTITSGDKTIELQTSVTETKRAPSKRRRK